MRDLKFRAWDNKNNGWLSANNDVYLESERGVFIEVAGASSNFLSKVDADIQLFTGLKDKNGKEIYEGDILKNGAGLFPVRLIVGKSISKIYYGYPDEHNFPCDTWCEIIGNIHENPDLLK